MKRSDQESGKAGSVSGVREPAELQDAAGMAKRIIRRRRPDISEQELEQRAANTLEEFFVATGGKWRPGERDDARRVLKDHEGLFARIAGFEAIDSVRQDPWRERSHGRKSTANTGRAAPSGAGANDASPADVPKSRRRGRAVSVREAAEVGDKSRSESVGFAQREHYDAVLNRIRILATEELAALRAEVLESSRSDGQRIKRLAKLERTEALFNKMIELAARPDGPAWTYTQLGELVLGKSGKDARKRVAADLAILVDRLAERLDPDELLG